MIYLLANVHATAYAVPQSATSTILDYGYSGFRVVHIFFLRSLLYFLRLRHIKYTGIYPYDDAPGGYENTQTQTADGLKKYLGIATTYGHYGHNFMPVASALDLQNQNYGSANMFQSSNMYYGIDNNIVNPGQVSGNTLSTSSLSPFKYVNTYTSDCGSVICADNDEYLGPEPANWNEYHGGYISNQATQFLIRKITNSNPSLSCSALDFCTASFQISGPSSVCTIGTYQIVTSSSLNGVNVQWSFPNGTLNITSGQGTPVVNVIKAAAGYETVTAVLTNSCGQQTTYQLPTTVTVGIPTFTTQTQREGGTCYYNIIANAPNVEFSTDNVNWQGYNSGNTSVGDFEFVGPRSVLVYARMVNACGTGPTTSRNYSIPKPPANCAYVQPNSDSANSMALYNSLNTNRIKLYPNPATNSVMISLSKNYNSAVSGFTIIQILDQLGNVRKQFKYLTPVSTATINVSDLSTDIYIVRVFDGEKWNNYKLNVRGK